MRIVLSTMIASWLLVGCSVSEKRTLPYLGNHQTVTKLIDGVEVIDTVYHVIPEFSVVNQDSQLVTHKDLEGKVSVVDFFFTSCPSICPIMTEQLVRVQKMTKDYDDFVILSYTVDPKRDTPKRMKSYAEKYACDTQNWQFLHGDKDVVYELGMIGYYLSMGEASDSPGGFIHSPTFVLVDQERHIRGMYDGTKANEVGQLYEDITLLMKKT